MDEKHQRLARLQGYLKVDQNNFALLSETADLALELGDWQLAADLVQRALEQNPHDPVARYRQIVILLQQRRHQEALAISTQLLGEGHAQPALRYAHARALVMAGAHEEAVPVLTALMAEPGHPDDFPALPHLTIRALHAVGAVDEAIEIATRHLAHRPEDSLAQGMASLLYFDNGDFEKASQMSTAALTRSPDNLDALLAAGSVALGLEQDEAARRHFAKVTSLHAENGRAWLGLGMALMRASDLPAARSAVQRAIEVMPGQLASYNVLAWIQIFEGDYSGARHTLNQSLEVDRNFGETHGTLAVVAACENRWDDVPLLAEKALRLDDQSFAGRYAQILILGHEGETTQSQLGLKAILEGTTLPGGGNLVDAMQRYNKRRRG